jgi:methylmalonyl-CoA mutase N-terminal domain/subunit
MKEQYHAQLPGSMWLRMIAGGGGGGLTLEQPENNIVRGAYYALIAALSGAQTMALCCFDEAYTIPSEHAQTLSLRTMQLLVEEMGLAETVDPLGGSYYVETLTNQMRAEMERIIAETDAAGGIVKLVADGTIQSRVSAQAYRMQRAIESGAFPKVGVNRYRSDKEVEHPVEMHHYRVDDARAQVLSLQQVRRERDAAAVARALARVESDARSSVNVMGAILEAVKAYASVGEITQQLVGVFGRYVEPVRFDHREPEGVA